MTDASKPALRGTDPEPEPHDDGPVERVPPFSIRHHLPHLLRRAHFESEGLFAGVYGEDVTSRQLVLLTAVEGHPGASQSAIAAAVGLDLNTCSDVVVRAVAKGLLRRQRSVADARTFALHLTADGHRVVATGRAQALTYANMVSARLDETERAKLVTLLRKMLGFT